MAKAQTKEAPKVKAAPEKTAAEKQARINVLQDLRESTLIQSYERVLDHFAEMHGMPFSTEKARLVKELEPIEQELSKLDGKVKTQEG